MISWPVSLKPLSALPTLPHDPRVPEAYFALLQTGQWPTRFFCPTEEPTSEGLTGASIHAFATVGPRLATPLPAHLLPFAADGVRYWCFDLATPGPAIRYIDWEVDQWLTVATDFDQFLARLQRVSPRLSPKPSEQEFAHAALIADEAALPQLAEYARSELPSERYGEWLAFWLKQPLLRHAAESELAFAHQYRWQAFSPALQSRLTAAL
ncbi:SMI1/KNR4 family protein [Lacticaseibacillus camelliae]|nr:SMI1/KNR4 family protein [Lacticaseibacillus camelliae]